MRTANELLAWYEMMTGPELPPEEMAAEIECCGRWLPYPQPGQVTACPGCGTRFTVSGGSP